MLLKQIARNWVSLAVILFFAILCGILYSFSSGDVRNFALSLGTCFLSALVLVIVVDISLAASNEQARLQLFSTSLYSLRPAFQQIGGVMFNIVKATAERPQEDKEASFSKIIEMTKMAETQYIKSRHEAPVFPKIDWLCYVTSAFAQLTESLSRFSEKYIMFIDRETIELCEKMIAHPFISLCNQAGRSSLPFSGSGEAMMTIAFTAFGENTPSHFHDYLSCLEKLNNKLVAVGIEIMIPISWGDGIAPKLGSARTAAA